MKKTDTLFKNAIVLTMDNELRQYTPGAVAVSGDSIVAAGAEEEILNAYQADRLIVNQELYWEERK